MIRRIVGVQQLSFVRPHEDRFSKEKQLKDDSVKSKNYLLYDASMKLPTARSLPITSLNLKHLQDTSKLMSSVPQLKHGLDRLLNGELVFGDHGVGHLPPNAEFMPESILHRMSNYSPPDRDNALLEKNKQHHCRYLSSTSNISSILIALYFLLSSFRPPKLDNIFSRYTKPESYMISFRKPTTFILKRLGNQQWSISSDPGLFRQKNQVLMNLGHIIQYFLTHEKSETEAILRQDSQIDLCENYYRYAIVNDQIMLRSQIDCRAIDKSGKNYVFEIKSRASAPIRYDVENYQEYLDYEIKDKRGIVESFERQYYDLIRGGFLKYAMQVKIGKMDGAFIAYHNTEQIYGYQYVKLKEMALRLFGDQYNLDISFLVTSKMLSVVLKQIEQQLGQEQHDNDLKIGFYADESTRKLVVMVQVMKNVKEYPVIDVETHPLNIFNYFEKEGLQNPVYKLYFSFYTIVNGIMVMNPDMLLTPHDSLQIKWSATQKRRASTKDYLNFLHEAYKIEELMYSERYRGMWHYTNLKID